MQIKHSGTKKADFVKVGFMVKIVYNLVTPYRGVDQLWVGTFYYPCKF